MAKVSPHKLPYKKFDDLWFTFCEVLSELEKPADIHRFLKDLLNRPERLMLIRRLQIAKMLYEGCTYDEIRRKMRAGYDTIGRVQRWLQFGRGGYKTAIHKLLRIKKQI